MLCWDTGKAVSRHIFYGGAITGQLKLRHPDLQADSLHFDTLEVHAGEPRDAYGALIPPI